MTTAAIETGQHHRESVEESTSQENYQTHSNRVPVIPDDYEGVITFFRDVVTINGSISIELHSALTLFNTGQQYLNEGNASVARRWLELASIRLKLTDRTEQVIPMQMVIAHNLGYCFYQMGRPTDAERCFKSALLLAKSASLVSEASVINRCIQSLVQM